MDLGHFLCQQNQEFSSARVLGDSTEIDLELVDPTEKGSDYYRSLEQKLLIPGRAQSGY